MTTCTPRFILAFCRFMSSSAILAFLIVFFMPGAARAMPQRSGRGGKVRYGAGRGQAARHGAWWQGTGRGGAGPGGKARGGVGRGRAARHRAGWQGTGRGATERKRTLCRHGAVECVAAHEDALTQALAVGLEDVDRAHRVLATRCDTADTQDRDGCDECETTRQRDAAGGTAACQMAIHVLTLATPLLLTDLTASMASTTMSAK